MEGKRLWMECGKVYEFGARSRIQMISEDVKGITRCISRGWGRRKERGLEQLCTCAEKSSCAHARKRGKAEVGSELAFKLPLHPHPPHHHLLFHTIPQSVPISLVFLPVEAVCVFAICSALVLLLPLQPPVVRDCVSAGEHVKGLAQT